jgi:MoaA/NifB/PqqE/SkfB family radical SAM enzyme
MNLESVTRLLPSLVQLQTQVVLISGGEPLLNPQWADIAQLLKENGQQPWLLTSGLSLAKHARRASNPHAFGRVDMDSRRIPPCVPRTCRSSILASSFPDRQKPPGRMISGLC